MKKIIFVLPIIALIISAVNAFPQPGDDNNAEAEVTTALNQQDINPDDKVTNNIDSPNYLLNFLKELLIGSNIEDDVSYESIKSLLMEVEENEQQYQSLDDLIKSLTVDSNEEGIENDFTTDNGEQLSRN
ncbi:uncharacterized protein LOC129801871 [Phlebotomus papatasi]|uniref:uncharacterized protein LOC129801871 n=1 Tax=Phlebotomus papatasi TaxID=29031 RepID=UPI0024838D4A|nr:uncharacterized protein LOC129801871 [Phlebotomus papatasi]